MRKRQLAKVGDSCNVFDAASCVTFISCTKTCRIPFPLIYGQSIRWLIFCRFHSNVKFLFFDFNTKIIRLDGKKFSPFFFSSSIFSSEILLHETSTVVLVAHIRLPACFLLILIESLINISNLTGDYSCRSRYIGKFN